MTKLNYTRRSIFQQRLLNFQQQKARLHNWLESQHSTAKDKDMDERRRLKEIGV